MDEYGRTGRSTGKATGVDRARDGRMSDGAASEPFGATPRRTTGPTAVRATGRSGGPGSRAPRRSRGADARRPASRPWPVRPSVVPVAVRPVQVERPACRATSPRPGQRLLDRRSPSPPVPALRLRRAVAGVALALVAAVVVVALGLLAGAVAQSRSAAPVTVSAGAVADSAVSDSPRGAVTVGTEETVWELARAVTPAASGAELAVSVERIVRINSLDSVRLQPGQVLRITAE